LLDCSPADIDYKERLEKQYRQLLRRVKALLQRVQETCDMLENECDLDWATLGRIAEIKLFLGRTEQVCSTARRRVLEGEIVPNEDKLFSIFEPHTQLYIRGKAGQPVQFGRLVLVYEDSHGFILHHHVMPRDAQDRDVTLNQYRRRANAHVARPPERPPSGNIF